MLKSLAGSPIRDGVPTEELAFPAVRPPRSKLWRLHPCAAVLPEGCFLSELAWVTHR